MGLVKMLVWLVKRGRRDRKARRRKKERQKGGKKDSVLVGLVSGLS